MLAPLGAGALRALSRGDLTAAGAELGLPIPDVFRDDAPVWRLRLRQLEEDPACAPWLIRAAVDRRAGVVVGHAGFHGPPDGDGLVEVGYFVVPEQRRRGYARAMLAELLDLARAGGARVVRASIAPGNVPSQALVARFGFRHVGEQYDDVDGRELVYERRIAGP